MNSRALNAIKGRLSLRSPQAESLEKLAQALDDAPEMLSHDRELESVLNTLKAEFPTLEDFEREFPSLTLFCFGHRCGQDTSYGGLYQLSAPGLWAEALLCAGAQSDHL